MAFLGLYWGEENNPKNKQRDEQSGGAPSTPDYDKAQKQWIDPAGVFWGHHQVNEQRVQQYMDDPNWSSFWNDDQDDPYVVIRPDGTRIAYNGKHRATAAMRRGRQVRARVWDMRKPNGR
jgi:hypothetical protein